MAAPNPKPQTDDRMRSSGTRPERLALNPAQLERVASLAHDRFGLALSMRYSVAM